MGKGMNRLCEMSHDGNTDWNELTLVPEFVVALANIFSTSPIRSHEKGKWSKILIKLTKGLLKSIRSLKISMRATLSGMRSRGTYLVTKPEIQVDVDMDIAEPLEIVEMLTKRTDCERSEPQRLDTTGDCRVDDRGEGEIVRLVEWFKEPIVQDGGGEISLYKEVSMDSWEWSSETQGWMQVEGWARLF